MLVKYKNRVIAFSLVALIGFMGFFADYYFVRYEIFDEMNSNYEFSTADENNVNLAYTVNFPLKTSLVDLNGFIRNLLGQRVMNGVVKLNNGHIIMPQEKFTDEQTQYCAEQIISYAQYCLLQGSKFVYIQPPINTDEDNKQLPAGVEDYRNENVDGVIALVQAAGVDVIDLRKCMKDDGMDIYDYVYRTDHHWTTRGAFYGFQHITDYIEQVTGKKVDPKYTNLNNYRFKVYKNFHLGSTGQRVGQYFAGADDYELILPDFETRLSDKDGKIYTFDQIAVNWDTFSNKDATSRYTYDHAFLSGWKNTEKTTQISALILSDSFYTAVSPYMELVYNGISVNYWRDGLNADVVKKLQPEVVIFMPYLYNNEILVYNPPSKASDKKSGS